MPSTNTALSKNKILNASLYQNLKEQQKIPTKHLLSYVTHLLTQMFKLHGEWQVVELDMSTAFNKVWHTTRFEYTYGFSPTFDLDLELST